MHNYPYPSGAGVDRTKAIDCRVLVEVLWYRQAEEDREA